jgi:RNA polymerase sigma factor (sigma-70 family)
MKSIMDVYSDISKANPPWKPEEESEFIQSCVVDNKWKDSASKDRFVNEAFKHNLNLVFKMMKKYSFKKTDEDVLQKAVIAMADALKRYDPASKNKISTWIQQPIIWAIKHTQHVYYKGHDIRGQIAALNHKYNLKMSVLSIDAKIEPNGTDNDTVGDFVSTSNIAADYIASRGIKTIDDETNEMEIKSGVADLMEDLPRLISEKELYVIQGLLKGQTMTEISVELKISRMRVSQIAASAFDKIRRSKHAKYLKGLVSQ